MIKAREHLENLERWSTSGPTRISKHRLDRNERNQPFSQKFVERIRSGISGEMIMVYPELEIVYEKVANWLGLSVDEIMLHSGSDQAIKAVFETYISPGDRVLLHLPGYSMYEVYCEMFGAGIVSELYDSDMRFCWDSFLAKLTDRIRMVVVENPSGYSGLAPSLEYLKRLIDTAAKHGTLVLVDEAYYHFHEDSAVDWIDKYDNLIITRSFSKALGLAGARAGYLISNKSNLEYLKKVRPVYEINSFAALVVSEIIENTDEYMSYVNDTRRNIHSMREGFARYDIPTTDSKANFVVARMGKSEIHNRFREALAKDGILIRRPFIQEWLQEWIRINTAPLEIQKILFEKLSNILFR